MTTREQVEELARRGEAEMLEFKATTGQLRAATRTLCAMLNHRGGQVLFGVTPAGVVAGQQVSDRTLEEVAQEIGELDPPAFPSVERVAVAGSREVLVVTVTQGHAQPYTHRGIPYRRVGNTSPRMSRDEYNRMLLERLHSEQRWENQPAEGWSVADLEVDEIDRTLGEALRRGRAEDPNTRDPTAILRGLGLMREGVLLRAAVVLFGRRERLEAEMPQCLLRVARFRGTDRTEFLDNRQLHVANAFCHRDYSIGGGSVAIGVYDDRLEVTSSGTLHFGLTPEALFQPHESLPWNPLIARVLYRRGIVEEWGRGTLKILDLTTQAGLPRPEIEDAGGSVTVRFHPTRYQPPRRVQHDLTDRQRTILAMLDQHRHGLALRDIRSVLTAAEWEVKADLALLKRLGLITTTGYGRGALWFLAPPTAVDDLR